MHAELSALEAGRDAASLEILGEIGSIQSTGEVFDSGD
jgi:hypothetical protein